MTSIEQHVVLDGLDPAAREVDPLFLLLVEQFGLRLMKLFNFLEKVRDD